MTPRFLDSLTVFDACGQWLDPDQGRLYRESTKFVSVPVPSHGASEGVTPVQEIPDAYKARFDQQAVFFTTSSACAAVY